MKLNSITLICYYLPPRNSTGGRRISYLINFLLEHGWHVNVISGFWSNQILFPGIISPHFKRLNYVVPNLLSSQLVCHVPLTEATLNSQPLSNIPIILWFLSLLKHFRNWIGHLIDLRILYVVIIYLQCLVNFATRGFLFPAYTNLFLSTHVLASCPPWPIIALAYLLSKLYKSEFIIDYRDQFSSNHMLSGVLNSLEIFIDSFFLRQASLVSCVSVPMAEYLESISGRKVSVVMNGFDETVFTQTDSSDYLSVLNALNNKIDSASSLLTISFFGTITRDRLMPCLWNSLLSVREQLFNKVCFEFYGDNILLSNYLSTSFPELLPFVKLKSSVSHENVKAKMESADILLFVETSDVSSSSARGVLTTKIFEYLALRKPVLCIQSPNMLASQILLDSGCCLCASIEESEISNFLLYTRDYTCRFNPKPEFIQTFSRHYQFDRFLDLL